MLVGLTGTQYDTGEVRTVRRVGEVLGLETYCRAEGECATIGALITRGVVGRVKLHTGFGGVALQCTSALRIGDSGSKAQFTLLALVQYVVVVEALAELDLLVVCIDVLTEGFRCAEIKRCTFHLQDLTRRNGGGIGGQIEVCIDLTDLILNRRGGVCSS